MLTKWFHELTNPELNNRAKIVKIRIAEFVKSCREQLKVHNFVTLSLINYFRVHTVRKSRSFWQKLAVRSALKRTPVQDFDYFSIIFYYMISSKYQKIGDLFCPVIFLYFRTVWRG